MEGLFGDCQLAYFSRLPLMLLSANGSINHACPLKFALILAVLRACNELRHRRALMSQDLLPNFSLYSHDRCSNFFRINIFLLSF